MKWADLPKGFTAEPIDWPEPQPVLMFKSRPRATSATSVLPIKITRPPTSPKAPQVTLGGKAIWMVCARQCNPASREMSLTLPVKASPTPAYDAEWHKKFEAERPIRPQASQAWSAQVATRTEAKIKHHTLTLTPKPGARPLSKEEAASSSTLPRTASSTPTSPRKSSSRTTRSHHRSYRSRIHPRRPPTVLSGVILRLSSWENAATWRCIRVTPRAKVERDCIS